ncbi:ribosomal protein L16p/L10e-domain-containing protein [Glomus cerebriforme]|uniref:Ribosomal protein L16p/L10e-domain-containing protein n=1 Tax=Glomus cerebriforme TaxID=658196 RepID=A0A397SEK9_9GLOM|nr:ribosomal protein L16p/L10e-domain-containing protein [Glomus cerebriforme]
MFSLNKIYHTQLLFKKLKYSPINYSATYAKLTPKLTLIKRNLFLPNIQNSSPPFINKTTILPNRLKLPLTSFFLQRRHRAEFAPRRTKYRKAHKGRVPVRIGGSTKGNTIAFGSFGLRVKDGVRLSSAQLTAAHTVIKRKIKVIKGSQVWMRVFPDIPVTSKGNETRMGKGKGSFEYYACRVPMNKILFEIGGGNIRREVAKEALRLATDRLPVKTEFVDKETELKQKKIEKETETNKIIHT